METLEKREAKERHASRSRVSPSDARVARRVPLVAVPPVRLRRAHRRGVARVEAKRDAVARGGRRRGYWAAQMRRSGMDVVAADVNPPGEGTHNAYHGSCAPWHPVVRGDAGAARSAGEKAASPGASRPPAAPCSCATPPGFDSRMASETLEAFVASIGSNRNHARDDETGHVLALVGEWDGNTADGAFCASVDETLLPRAPRRAPAVGGHRARAHGVETQNRKPSSRRAHSAQVVRVVRGGGRVEGDAFSATKPNDDRNVLRRCVFVSRRPRDVLLGFVRAARRGEARGDARASADTHAHRDAGGLVRPRRVRRVSLPFAR